MNEIRRVVRSVDISSAATMAFALTASLFAIVLVGLVALYLLGLVSGGLGGVEGFIASLGFTGFRFTILPFILAFNAVGLLVSAVVAVLVAIAALLYNHLQPIVGGVEVYTRDRG